LDVGGCQVVTWLGPLLRAAHDDPGDGWSLAGTLPDETVVTSMDFDRPPEAIQLVVCPPLPSTVLVPRENATWIWTWLSRSRVAVVTWVALVLREPSFSASDGASGRS
jgi:hypothetical protein